MDMDMQLTKLTQAQAARAAGVSRTTIWRAIKDGQLSYERSDGKNVLIDASELLRVYPEAALEHAHERSRDDASNVHEREAAGEIRALRELVDELRQDKGRLQTELDRAAEERGRLLSMLEAKDHLLTDQREKTDQAHILVNKRERNQQHHSPPLWSRLWRRAS
jgi:excisionase family DNA binding protein